MVTTFDVVSNTFTASTKINFMLFVELAYELSSSKVETDYFKKSNI